VTEVLFLIPLSIGMGLIGLGAFLWALRNQQFDDPAGVASRILTPQDPPAREAVLRDDTMESGPRRED
jgi:cbb3-type cytochrome oxidase maturation protein